MDYKEVLYNILITIITAVVPVLTAYAVNFIRKKSAELQTKTNNEYVDVIINSTENLITTVVTSLSQTVVDTAKKNKEFTPALAKEVLNTAKTTILNAMTEEAKHLIETLYHMSVEEYVTVKIEQKVKELK